MVDITLSPDGMRTAPLLDELHGLFATVGNPKRCNAWIAPKAR
jgi:hypothetical protein